MSQPRAHNIVRKTDGFELDRLWVLADAQGNCITQRVHSRMVLIAPTIELNDGGPPSLDASLTYEGSYQKGGRMVLNAPSMPALVVPFHRYDEHGQTSLHKLVTETYFA